MKQFDQWNEVKKALKNLVRFFFMNGKFGLLALEKILAVNKTVRGKNFCDQY